MEVRAALPIQKINRDGYCSSGNSEFTSSSLPVLPTPSAEDFAMLPQSQQVLRDREIRNSPLIHHQTPFVSGSSIVGSFYSSPLGFCSEIHESSLSLHERRPPFATQSPDVGVSFHSDKSYTGSFEPMTNSFSGESTEVAWCADTIENVNDYSDNAIVNNQIPKSSSVVSNDPTKQTEWWEDIMNGDWKEILNETTTIDSQAKVCGLKIFSFRLRLIRKFGSFLFCYFFSLHTEGG